MTVVRPDVTLTELMNILSLSGIRFTFDPTLKKGSNSSIPETNTNVPVVPETPTILPDALPEEV